MGKVILICGKICSGKSTYAERLRKRENAVVLSCDELTLALFDGELGAQHDEISARIKRYLLRKAAELTAVGCNVILEWGFWEKHVREEVRGFYESRGIPCELHCVDISDAQWRENIRRRNVAVANGSSSAYLVDDGLLEKLNRLYEKPDESEADVWVTAEMCINDG